MHGKHTAQSQISIQGIWQSPSHQAINYIPSQMETAPFPFTPLLTNSTTGGACPPSPVWSSSGHGPSSSIHENSFARLFLRSLENTTVLCCSSLIWSCPPLCGLESWTLCKFYVTLAMNGDTLAICSACLPNNQPLGNWKLSTVSEKGMAWGVQGLYTNSSHPLKT